jgi:hypothetical protein
MTPAKALRMLIDIERRERARDERRAARRARINAAIERMLNPFARKDRPNA